jgi:hypothetical protein
MKVYDGASWIAATSAGNVSLTTYQYTATSGQTTFSGADDNAATLTYTVNNILVTLNGSLLFNGTDYTATNGTSIVLSSGATASDVLQVTAFASFTTADMVPASTGGTFSGNVTFSGAATVNGAFTSQGIDDNATSTAMTLDSSGALLVGKTADNLTDAGQVFTTAGSSFTRSGGAVCQFNRNTSDGEIVRLSKDGSTVGSIGSSFGNLLIQGAGNISGLRFDTNSFTPFKNGSEANGTVDLGYANGRFKDGYFSGTVNSGGLTVDGNVGIGTSSTTLGRLTVIQDYATNADTLILKSPGASGGGSQSGIKFVRNTDATLAQIYADTNSGAFITNVAGSEAMRIDSSGNLLVGTTNSAPASNNVDGVSIRVNNSSQFSRTSGAALSVNRKTSDGDIAVFSKDGTTVGSIGSRNGSAIVISSDGGSGVNFGLTAFNPWYNGSISDNVIDLGQSAHRYDDIYATNGTIQTSDQNEKQQIASLTDAEITAAKAISKLFKTFKWNDSVAEKGDAARTHSGVIAQDVEQAMTDAGLNAGDYAFFISTTWWETQTEVPAVEADEENGVEAQEAYTRTDTYETAEEAPEGATERNRKGIRYPQLLSFIGAATEQRLASIETRLDALEAN